MIFLVNKKTPPNFCYLCAVFVVLDDNWNITYILPTLYNSCVKRLRIGNYLNFFPPMKRKYIVLVNVCKDHTELEYYGTITTGLE